MRLLSPWMPPRRARLIRLCRAAPRAGEFRHQYARNTRARARPVLIEIKLDQPRRAGERTGSRGYARPKKRARGRP